MLAQIGLVRPAGLFGQVTVARYSGAEKWWRRHRLRQAFHRKGECRTIEPPHVLAFTWLPDWQRNPTETLVRFDLTEKDGLTTLRLTHSGLTPEGLKAHKGWPQILVWSRGYVEH